MTEIDACVDLHGIQIDVRLHEAVEQDQTIGTTLTELLREVGQGAEIRTNFDGQRDLDL